MPEIPIDLITIAPGNPLYMYFDCSTEICWIYEKEIHTHGYKESIFVGGVFLNSALWVLVVYKKVGYIM